MQLAEDQKHIFELVEQTDVPLFITGAAGTGKSALLRHLSAHGKDAEFTAVVAPTGAAAINVNGTTIHNFALQSNAFGQTLEVYVPLPENRELKKKNFDVLSNTRLLIIDEVSMVRADLIDALDRAFRLAKNQPQKLFGGTRLVMFGDLFQLPPFVQDYELKRRERKFLRSYEDPEQSYFFMAHAFALNPIKTLELTIQKRQVSDTELDADFIDALNEVRSGEPAPWAMKFLNEFESLLDFAESPRLFAKRKKARAYNESKLALLSGESKRYVAEVTPDFGVWQLDDEKSPAPRIVDLKLGALVMVTRNIDLSLGLVNGALATVEALGEDSVSVRLHRDQTLHVLEKFGFELLGYTLDVEDDGDDASETDRSKPRRLRRELIGVFKQIPLMLAWGVTIHKAQGATLDSAVVDFTEDFRSAGQSYVAISRVKKIHGLQIQGEFRQRHLVRHSEQLLAFADVEGASANTSFTDLSVDFESKFLAQSPWRREGWLSQTVDKYLDVIPALPDKSGYDHKRRMQYLRDFLDVEPSDYLNSLADFNPALSFAIAQNLDRSVKNFPPLADELVGTISGDLRLRFNATEWEVMAAKRVNPASWQQVLRDRMDSREDLPLEDWLVLERANLESVSWLYAGSPKKVSVRESKGYWFEHWGEPTALIEYGSGLIISQSDEGFRDLVLSRVNAWNARGVSEIDFAGEMTPPEIQTILRYMFEAIDEVEVIRLNGKKIF